ncbi:hypothetical protein CPLU01_15735 [Colletotrichum plurivorum]|uniref:Uncharacterized protein n=1 Tax=Colletotrichum plurivorum TaxID=2175906 RepID=A0A8H6J8A6_9PEZI|nr:hypothetical protein CPLU01_15735 [Colletotrichum plurivorum]
MKVFHLLSHRQEECSVILFSRFSSFLGGRRGSGGRRPCASGWFGRLDRIFAQFSGSLI